MAPNEMTATQTKIMHHMILDTDTIETKCSTYCILGRIHLKENQYQIISG
jgi:hypothetical protein